MEVTLAHQRLAAGLVVAALTGCATNTLTRSGFVSNYDAMQPTRFERVRLYRAPDFDAARYARIEIEPAVIATHTGQLDGLDAAQTRELVAFVEAELRRLARPVAQPSGLATLRLRAAITEVQTPNRVVNAMTTLALGPVTTGGASLEFEAIDPQHGQRVVSAACYDHGHVIANFTGSYTLLGHARSAITTCIGQISEAWLKPAG